MPLSVHVSGPSNTIGVSVMQQCAIAGSYGYALGSTIYAMLTLISPPKNMKVDIDGDNDDLTVNIHPL